MPVEARGGDGKPLWRPIGIRYSYATYLYAVAYRRDLSLVYAVPMVNPMTEERHFTEQLVRVPKQMGAAIRRRRRMLQLSQKDVGAKACVRQATISALEKGELGYTHGHNPGRDHRAGP